MEPQFQARQAHEHICLFGVTGALVEQGDFCTEKTGTCPVAAAGLDSSSFHRMSLELRNSDCMQASRF